MNTQDGVDYYDYINNEDFCVICHRPVSQTSQVKVGERTYHYSCFHAGYAGEETDDDNNALG